jgi:hypothetical protein
VKIVATALEDLRGLMRLRLHPPRRLPASNVQ